MEEEVLRALVEQSPSGFALYRICVDAVGLPINFEFALVNTMFEQETGIARTDVIGRRISDALPIMPDDAADLIKLFVAVATDGIGREFENYLPRLHKWYRAKVFMVAAGWLATNFVDITTEKTQLTELENFFRVNLDLLCIVDGDGNFLKANRAWEEFSGLSAEELQKRKILEFVHPDDLATTMDAIALLGEQEVVLDFINRYRGKDGIYRYIEWRSQPSGNVIYAAARDINERILNEQRICESDLYNKALLDAIPYLMFVLEADGIFLDCKAGSDENLMMPKEQFIGKSVYEVMPPHMTTQIRQGIAAALTGRSSMFEYQLPIMDKTGYFECNIVAFGQSKVIAMITNITERKLAELALVEKAGELELTQNSVIECIVKMGEFRNMEVGKHSVHTRAYVKIIADKLRVSAGYQELFTEKYLRNLLACVPLHDIGKVIISDALLLKPERLTAEEMEAVKRHTTIGKEILQSAEKSLGENSFLSLAIQMAESHHEHWDGSGYPSGLSGEAIPLPGRIMAIGDVYDAMVSQRVYKTKNSHAEAIEFINSGRGTQFDPLLVDIFVELEQEFLAISLEQDISNDR